MGGIDLDLVRTPFAVPASNHFTKEQNGLINSGLESFGSIDIQPISYLGEAAWPLLPYRRRKPSNGSPAHENPSQTRRAGHLCGVLLQDWS